MDELNKAKEEMLEWWDIFSKTGDINDARMLIESLAKYDSLLLTQEDNLEM